MGLNITMEGKLLFPSEYVAAFDLKGKDSTVTISKIELSDLRLEKGGVKRKPVVHFEKTSKKLVLNKTNAAVIAILHGPVVEKWVGKKIILFPTTTTCGRNTVDCIRVRDYQPDQPREVPVDGLTDDMPEFVPDGSE